MFDLLDTVLPTEGRYCIIGIGKYTDQRFADTREEAEELIQEFVGKKWETYFGCAKFGPEDNRTHDNALYFRALWMDIDCGPEKAAPDKNGKIKGLAVTTIKRSALMPELPTIAESGLKGYDANNWYGVMVPAKTPRAVINRLNAETTKVLNMPDVKSFLFNQGLDAAPGTPEAFGAYIKAERVKWAKVIKAAGANADTRPANAANANPWLLFICAIPRESPISVYAARPKNSTSRTSASVSCLQ